MNIEEGFQLKDLQPMIRRRLFVSSVVAGTIFLGAIVLAAWLPNQFSSSATILVEPQAISESLIASGLRESDLNKRLNIMTAQILSRPRLSRIIDDLGLYAAESEELTREQIIEKMRAQILVDPVIPELQAEGPKNREVEINTFRITFWSDSASTAAAVANRLAQDFIDQHIRERVQLSGDTSEFIQSELERLTNRIREVESQIAQVKEENSGSLPEEIGNNQRQLTRLMDRQQDVRNALALAQSDAAFYEQQALVAADEPRFNDHQTNPSRRYDQLEIALGALRARGYTDKHPDVIETLSEMEEVKVMIEAEKSTAEDEEAPKNLAQQTAAAQASRSRLAVENSRAELEPTSPNRVLIVAMGLVLGLALGGMTGLLVESADTSFHGARQLQGALRIPVLAAIPSIVLESDRIAARRRSLRRGIVTAGIVGAVLGSSLFGYWWTNMAGSAPSASERPAQTTAPAQGG